MFKKALTYLFFLLAALTSAQKKQSNSSRLITIKSADSFSFDQEKNNAQVLRGNVQCEHEGTLLFCDTAYIYQSENRMVATGHILITKGDSIRVTGDKLYYEGKTRMATLQNNVKCTEKDMVLTTNLLTFDVGRSVANYYNGGTIVNKENTLTSRNGHYYSGTKEAAFHFDVVLTNPDYKMNSDTLRYRIPNKTSYFLGPSIITSKTDYIYCENGWYDTDKEKAQFSRNALLVTKEQKLRGDSLVYDRNLKIGKAYRNVTLIDTSQKSVITGNFVQYKQLNSEALVTGRATYARVIESDTLFIAADTLYHTDKDSTEDFLNAYHHVRLFKRDFQAVCDSSTLDTSDSLLQLFTSPVLWTGKMQATSKVMTIDIGNNRVKGFRLDGRAFLSEETDTLKKDKYNQLSGKLIRGIITADTIRKITVLGSAEMLYYVKNKQKFSGLNHTTCSEINMWFRKGESDRITMKPKTEGKVDPLREVDTENAKLKGFSWQYERRPVSRFDLYRK